MTRKELRSTIFQALSDWPWFVQSGVRVFMLNGTPEALDAYEGDLRSTDAGAVILVGHILRGKYVDSAGKGAKVSRTCDAPVLVRINLAHASAPDPDDTIDEVIKAVSGEPQNRSGTLPLAYVSESLLQEQSPSVFSTSVTFTARIITSKN